MKINVWAACLIALLVCSPTVATAKDKGKVASKIADELKKLPKDSFKMHDVVVQFKFAPSDSVLNAITKFGGKIKKKNSRSTTVLLTLPKVVIDLLESNPAVRYASMNRKISPRMDMTLPSVGATIAQQYGWDGTNVGVAIIDSGISPDADFGNRIVYSESFVEGDSSTGDKYGHGTHVAGIVAGAGTNSSCSTCTKSFRGVAPGAKLINLRVLDGFGSGTDYGVISAIDRAIELKIPYNIRVINLSLGRNIYESYNEDPLCQAVERAWKAGIAVVVAAGNSGRDRSFGTDGYFTITSPANHPNVITVGAMRHMDTPLRTDDLVAS